MAVFAHVEGSNVYQGSIADATGKSKLVHRWRIWEEPGPVTVRKWDGK